MSPHSPNTTGNRSFIPHRARSTALTLTAATALLASTGIAQASPVAASVDLAEAPNVEITADQEVASELPSTVGGAASEDLLTDAVVEDTLAEYGTGLPALDEEDREVRVDIRETDGEAAFGVAIVTAATDSEAGDPQAWLFTSEYDTGEWLVGLEGTPEFSDMLADSELMDAEQRETVSTTTDPDRVSSSQYTGVGLPFRIGTSMIMTGGPHGGVGQSVDFAGGNGTAHASRGGYAYSLCNGWTRVIHDNGYSTDYYHLEDYQWLEGNVPTGHYLGTQGNSLCAGGSTTGAHIHYSLRAYSDPNAAGWFVPVNGKTLGGWTFVEGASYGGYAYRGNATVYPGQWMYNHGF
ncbi:M23 family metallopeptidase [Nocardiopsis kunsanensis]|uniref:peptidoglycan DD-metalloendopeptidase family protein n=1 Tax=Nocardiopsis kunsanensis TaxID=141693 RepID=UPI00034550DB